MLSRTLLAAVLLMPIAFAKGAVRPVLRRWRPLLAYSVIEIVVPWLFLTRAEQHITSSLAGLLIAAVPFASVGVAVAFGRRERLGRMGLGGLLVGFAGVAFLVGVDVGGSQLGAVAEMAVVVALLRDRRGHPRPVDGRPAGDRRRGAVRGDRLACLRAVRGPGPAQRAAVGQGRRIRAAARRGVHRRRLPPARSR